MSKKTRTSTLRKRLEDGMLNMFAVFITVLPVFSIGYFVHYQFFSDARKVVALQSIDSGAPRLFEEGLVSVTFDDGWESIYSSGAPLLDEYDIPTTQYILPGEFDSRNYISKQQAKSLQKAGHEIASHSMSHPLLTEVDDTRMRYELTESKKMLAELGLTGSTAHFAAPESAVNPAITKAISETYASHRNTFGDIENGVDENDVNIRTNFMRYDIIGYTVRTDTTVEHIKSALDYAKRNNGWLVLVYHQLDDSGTKYSVKPADFEKHLQLIRDSRVKPATIGNVMKGYKV